MRQPDINHVTTRATYEAILLDLAFIQTYNTTAHQGLLKDRRVPPIPVEVLGAAKGRMYAPEELAHHFSQAVFPQMTNRVVCHPTPARRRRPHRSQPQQLALFEWVHTG
jgi:hypothetical protein